jgi:hypothetical protein
MRPGHHGRHRICMASVMAAFDSSVGLACGLADVEWLAASVNEGGSAAPPMQSSNRLQLRSHAVNQSAAAFIGRRSRACRSDRLVARHWSLRAWVRPVCLCVSTYDRSPPFIRLGSAKAQTDRRRKLTGLRETWPGLCRPQYSATLGMSIIRG